MLTCIEHETSPNPLASVIWMHGLGADGSDFAGIVPQLNLRHCPPIRFVFPNAPSMPVTVNNGYVMPKTGCYRYHTLSPSYLRIN